ncbi:MAG: hypothetical protein K6G57_01935 [Lachnospiraceae bacterium]|nr:hypothetical protein [Lachnospiraceae bacterium]
MKSSSKKPVNQSDHQAGVYPSRKKNGEIYYRASMTVRSKHISLGSFDTATEAHKAYLEGKRILENKSIDILGYNKKYSLGYDKFISLLNFRDNGYYFATPIYMRQRLFYYCLTPKETLKFDLDDLFYYSSHRISKRGGHLFVADYGSQISVRSRFGLMPYSVEGRDYRFRNGDNTDYRRENLEIINTYNGVIFDPGSNKYLSRIHVKGYVTVGRYDSALEAAIAYNKAIDMLSQKGSSKNYAPNYIDEVSPRVYADIYSVLTVSDYFSV